MREFGSSEEDVERMMTGLEKDGWKREDYLPNGWMSKYSGIHRSNKFITPDFLMCKNQKQALKVIMTGYSREEVWRFISSLWFKEDGDGEVRWLEDPSLPKGWMLGCRVAIQSSRSLVIISDQGSVFGARRDFR